MGDLSLLDGARGTHSAVAFLELVHASGRIDELLFAGEERMASGADAELDVLPCRAGAVGRATRADD